jgi:type I restriction enzyme, S subunit
MGSSRTLGDVTTLVRGAAYQARDLLPPGQPFITIKCFNKGGGYRPDVKTFAGAVRSEHRVTGGELLIANTDLTRDATIAGAPAVLPILRSPAVFSMDVSRLIEDPAKADVRFLFFRLLAPDARSFMQARCAGSTVLHLHTREVSDFQFRLPQLEEQRRIAAILDTIDDVIHKTEQLIAKLKQMKQGLLHDLLTRGVDDNGELRDPERHPEQFQESVLGRIPKSWQVRLLGDLTNVSRGKFTHRPRNDPAYYGGRYPFIQTGDVAANVGGYLSSYSQTLSERGIAVSQEFPTATIAVTIAANIADTTILTMPMYFPDSVVGVVVVACVNVRYIELCIRRAKRTLDARAPQSAQKNINLQDLRPLPIPIPAAVEQERIANRYEGAQRRIGSEECALSKLRTLKAGLMDDLLTGRVRTNP